MAVSHNFFGVDSDDDSLSSNTDRPTRMLHRPSEAEWEEHRPLIEHFYMVENMTLKELMKAMRLSCNFVATERPYKRRLRAWNVRKNIRLADGAEEHAQAMLKTIGGQASRGHVQLPNGQLVAPDRLASYLRRRRRSTNCSSNSRESTYSPEPSAFGSPDPPPRDRDVVLEQVRAYILGRFGDKVNSPETCDDIRLSSWTPVAHRWARFDLNFRKAVADGGCGSGEVLRCLRQAPEELTIFMHSQPVDLLSSIFKFLECLCRHASTGIPEGRQMLRVAKSLLLYMGNHVACPNGLNLGHDHPLVVIFQGLAKVEDDYLLETVVRSWKLSCMTWASMVGFENSSAATINDWVSLAARGIHDHVPSNPLETIDSALQKYERRYGASHPMCHSLLASRASYLASTRREQNSIPGCDVRILDTWGELLRREPSGNETRPWLFHKIAKEQLDEEETQEAEKYSRLCIEATVKQVGDDPLVSAFVLGLEQILSDAGPIEGPEEIVNWLKDLKRIPIYRLDGSHQAGDSLLTSIAKPA